MKAGTWVFAAAAALAAGVAFAQSGADVLKARGCLNCHEADKKKVGPALKDIAAKHKDDKNDRVQLTFLVDDKKVRSQPANFQPNNPVSLEVKSRVTAPPTWPASTRPELIPARKVRRSAVGCSSLIRATVLRRPMAAFTACRGASSMARGAPKSAMMQSPMYLSTCPP